jgi:hypothetical protein
MKGKHYDTITLQHIHILCPIQKHYHIYPHNKYLLLSLATYYLAIT